MELAASTMRLAITARTPRSGSTLLGCKPDAGMVGEAEVGEAEVGAAAAAGVFRYASTSSFNTRPSLPLPGISDRTR